MTYFTSVLVAASLVASAGCTHEGGGGGGVGGGVGSGSGDAASPTSPLLVAMEDLKARMCACADAPCVDAVGQEAVAWQLDNAAAVRDADWATTAKFKRLRLGLKNCARDVKANQPGSPGWAMRQMDRFRDALCACTDAACAQRVTDDMSRWSREFAGEVRQRRQSTTGSAASEDPPTASDDERRMHALTAEMQACAVRAMGGADAGPPIAPAPAPAAPADPWK